MLDLAWSPANQWLASCSIDNTVVIWNVEKFPEIATVLKGHSSLVKVMMNAFGRWTPCYSNTSLHCSHGITPKRVTRSGDNLRSITLGNTPPKKRRSSGEPLATLTLLSCIIYVGLMS